MSTAKAAHKEPKKDKFDRLIELLASHGINFTDEEEAELVEEPVHKKGHK